MTIIDVIFNPILGWLLYLDPLLAIIAVSFILAVIITLIYKWVTDQRLMKELKDDIKSLQNEMKQYKENPTKMLEIQKKAMDKNMQYMMQSLRPTLVTFIPIILIFAWMNAHMAFYPIQPNTEFTTTLEFDKAVNGNVTLKNEDLTFITNSTQKIADGKAQWKLKGNEGNYVLEYKYKEKSYFQDLTITSAKDYRDVLVRTNEKELKTLRIDNEAIKPLNLFGWKIGWLGSYIIFSILFSILTRKMFNVY